MPENFQYNGFELEENQFFIPQEDVQPNWDLIGLSQPSKNPSLLLQARRETLAATNLYSTIKPVQEQSAGKGPTGRFGFVVTIKPQPQQT
jgi:hypothetical protein